MNFQNTSQDLGNTCCACLSIFPSHMMCTFEPCMHEAVCPNCAVELPAENCPLCRSPIESVIVKSDFQQHNETRSLTLKDLRTWKKRIHETAISYIPVVLVIGDSRSGKSELVEGMKVSHATSKSVPVESFYSTPYGPQVDFAKTRMSFRLVPFAVPWETGPMSELNMNMPVWDIPIIVICVRSVSTDLNNSTLRLDVHGVLKFLDSILRLNVQIICVVTMEDSSRHRSGKAYLLEKELTSKLVGDHIAKVLVVREGEDASERVAVICDTMLSENIYRPVHGRLPKNRPL